MPKVYLAGPISGLSFDEANGWRRIVAMSLKPIECVSPLRGADFQPDNYFNPNGERWTTMREIFARDHWDVMTCDVMFINFIGAKKLSRGTLMEIAWAHAYRKPIICAMETPFDQNPNWDVFMEQAVLVFEETLDDAIAKTRLLLNVRSS